MWIEDLSPLGDMEHMLAIGWLGRGHTYPVGEVPMAVYKKPYAGEVSSIWDTELIDHEATAANYAYAAQYALTNNLRLSIQMHLMTAIA